MLVNESYQFVIRAEKAGLYPCSSNDAKNEIVSEATLSSLPEQPMILYLTSESLQQAPPSNTDVAKNAPMADTALMPTTKQGEAAEINAVRSDNNPDTLQKGFYIVTSPQLNLREGDGATFKLIGKLKKDEKVEVLSVSDGWAKIMLSDNVTSGYVLFKYLAKVQESDKSKDTSPIEKKSGNWWYFILVFVIVIIVILGKGSTKKTKTTSEYVGLNKGHITPKVKEKPTFWYQCKNCGTSTLSESPPSSAHCSSSTFHNWNRLGNVGNLVYQCKICKTIIETKSQPSASNCPNSTFHQWSKLAEVGDVTFFCQHCKAKIKTKSQPFQSNCPNSTFHSWTKL